MLETIGINTTTISIIILNLICHLVLVFVNWKKNDSIHPQIYKLGFYSIILTLNIIFLIPLLYILDKATDTSIISFVFFTTLVFGFHYVLDEDLIFRFDKFINYLCVAIVLITGFVVWGFFML